MKNHLHSLKHFFLLVISGLFFVCNTYGQASIDWVSGNIKADAVNVGSGKPAHIEFHFEVQDAPIPGAKIEIQFPSDNADYYDLLFPAIKASGAYVDYSGNIAWNSLTRTLTFSGVNLGIGNNVWYTIPHFATDALSSATTSNQVTITVKDASDAFIDSRTISYNYNRAQLLIDNPASPESNQSGLALDFGTNTWSYQGDSYSTETYKFGLKIANGSIDSCRVKVVFPKKDATIVPGTWKCNNIPVTRVVETSDATNFTYTLYLDKNHSAGNDGFDNGENVDIQFDIKKKYCGNTDVKLSAAWGSSADYVSSSVETGSFSADSPTDSPKLERVQLTTTPAVAYAKLQNPGGKLYMDGVTPNIFHVKVKNSALSGPACEITYSLTTSGSPYATFLSDATPVRYSMDNGNTWKTVTPTFGGNKGNSGNMLLYDKYKNKKTTLSVTIPEDLPAQGELLIEWGSITVPDAFYNAPGKDRHWYRSIRHDDSWTYKDLCREVTGLGLSGTAIFSRADIILGRNFGSQVKLENGNEVTSKALALTFAALSSSYPELNHTSAYYQVRIALPKGIFIKEISGNPDVYFKRADSSINPYQSFIKTTRPDSTIYTFDFKSYKTSAERDLYITYTTDCILSDGVYQADISVDYLPSGTDGGTPPTYDVRMSRVAQFYCPISVSCNPQGVTYDFDMKRLTVGLWDTSNNARPDNATDKIDNGSYLKLDDTDLKQVVSGDTILFEFEGTVKGTSNNKVLYALLFSQDKETVYKVLEYTVSGDYPPYTIDIDARNNNGSKAHPTGWATPFEFMYGWKIKRQGGVDFANNEKVTLRVKCKAIDNSSSYTPVTTKFTSWFYSTNAEVSDMLSPGTKQGDEEYSVTSIYYKGYFTGWSTLKSSINFTGKYEEEGYAYLNPWYSNYSGFSPFEFRTIATFDSIIVEIPEGYLVDNTMKFRMNNMGTGLNSQDFYANAHPSSTKHRKVFCIKDMYVANYGPAIPASNKIAMTDGQADMTMYPLIKSTPRTQPGETICRMKTVVDNHTHTHAYVPNTNKPVATQFSTFKLIAQTGLGISISTGESTTKNLSSSRMSWDFRINNTKPAVAQYIWLYVSGPVTNVAFNNVNGVGEGGRWVSVPSVSANGNISDYLSFDVLPDNGCTNQSVIIYPFYNENEPVNWLPLGAGTVNDLTDAKFTASKNADGGDYDLYVYRELTLTMNTVASQISGSITPWSATPGDPSNPGSPVYGMDSVEVDKPFTVELLFDASGSTGPVSLLETEINFPKGLTYVPGSVYLEYNGTTLQVTHSDWEDKLAVLTDAASSSPAIVTLKLEDILSQTNIPALFGSKGTIDGGKIAKLRFQLIPTCSIDMEAEQIKAKFAGKRYCSLTTAATGSNDQSYTSGKLTLDNALLPFRSDLTFHMDKDSLVCESLTDSTEMTFTFRKITKLAEAMQVTDSVKIEVPPSLILDGEIHYTYPAYSSHIPAPITGTIPASDIRSYVEDTIRYISWPLPIDYYDKLYPTAESNQVTLTYKWKVKTGKDNLVYSKPTRVYVAARAARSPHFQKCTYTIIDADSIITPLTLIPAKIVTLPDTLLRIGYVIKDINGDPIMTTDTIIYNGDEFRFTVDLQYGYTKSVPEVKANKQDLPSIGQGYYYFNYGFDVLEDTDITIDSVQLNRYTVVFDTGEEGEAIKPLTGVIHGTTISKPPFRPRHYIYDKFHGWYENLEYHETWNFDTTRIVNDTILYAKWSLTPVPEMMRRVDIPEVEGIITNPDPGMHYIKSGEDFHFTVRYSAEEPLKVRTGRIIEGIPEELTGVKNAEGNYEYIIREVRTTILMTIGPDLLSGETINEAIYDGASVWSHKGKLYLKTDKEELVNIYSITGQPVKRLKIPAGTVTIPLNRGIYIVTLSKANLVRKVLVH